MINPVQLTNDKILLAHFYTYTRVTYTRIVHTVIVVVPSNER